MCRLSVEVAEGQIIVLRDGRVQVSLRSGTIKRSSYHKVDLSGCSLGAPGLDDCKATVRN